MIFMLLYEIRVECRLCKKPASIRNSKIWFEPIERRRVRQVPLPVLSAEAAIQEARPASARHVKWTVGPSWQEAVAVFDPFTQRNARTEEDTKFRLRAEVAERIESRKRRQTLWAGIGPLEPGTLGVEFRKGRTKRRATVGHQADCWPESIQLGPRNAIGCDIGERCPVMCALEEYQAVDHRGCHVIFQFGRIAEESAHDRGAHAIGDDDYGTLCFEVDSLDIGVQGDRVQPEVALAVADLSRSSRWS